MPPKNLAPSVGIDDIALYVPRHYLPIVDLAEARGIDPAKLTDGLGLRAMALPDTWEDTATMAANAVRALMRRHGIAPAQIGRLYLGTESALDGAKPTATYALEMLRRSYRDEYGPDCFTRCDVIDMTFACIGAVDALLNTADWVRGGTGRIGIVVASDFAKYELGSTGEYTQGAGAVAMLVRENAALVSLQPAVGVATRGVHDFFKPVRTVTKASIVDEVLGLLGSDARADEVLAGLPATFGRAGTLDANEEAIGLHRVTPTFDGPYSNWTYQRRVREAYAHYVELVAQPEDEQPLFTWSRIAMHLPYAAHGRRMLMDLFVRELERQGVWSDIAAATRVGPLPRRDDAADEEAYEAEYASYLRAVGKTSAYRDFATEQLAGSAELSAQVGNLYAGSVFLALVGVLKQAADAGAQLAGKTIGVIGYGSGSKSKVFACAVRGTWEERVAAWDLDEQFAARAAIDYATYERLHRGQLDEPLAPPAKSYYLERLGTAANREGARYYAWAD